MTLAHVLARAAQSHALIQGAVVPDLGGLTDDHAHTVVDEQALTDGGAGVDLNTRLVPCPLADGAGGEVMLRQVELVGHAVGQDGVNARIQEQDLQITSGGGVALADGGDVVGDLCADGGHGVGDRLCRLFAEAGEVEVDDILVIRILTAHGRYLTGVEWGSGEGSAVDLFTHHMDDALKGGRKDHVDDELKDEVDARATDENEVNGVLTVVDGLGKRGDGIKDHEAACHEHARIDDGGNGGGQEDGQQLVLFRHQLVDHACQIAREGGLDKADTGGDDGILLEQEGGEGIQTHHATLDIDLQAEHEAQPCACGGTEDHGTEGNGDQHQADRRTQHGDLNDDACRLKHQYDGGENGELHHFQQRLISFACHKQTSFEDFHLMLPSAVGTARKNIFDTLTGESTRNSNLGLQGRRFRCRGGYQPPANLKNIRIT